MNNVPLFKIRASAASEILAGCIGLTDVQSAKLAELQDRFNGLGKPLTANMEAEREKLVYKLDHPELPTGAKTYCEKWLKEKLYDRRKNFTNQYLDKGIQVEDESIQFAAQYYGWDQVEKNEEWFSDDWFEGTPDIITELDGPTIIDMKNVWDCFTMPLFEDQIPTAGYETQLQVYMHLASQEYKVEFNNALLVYSLMDAPLNVMEKEMRRLSWEEGQQGLITDEIRQRVHREMTYSNLPDELRLKSFEVKRDPAVIEELKKRVELCREYIAGLLKGKVETLKAA
jgi:hypothetical protein